MGFDTIEINLGVFYLNEQKIHGEIECFDYGYMISLFPPPFCFSLFGMFLLFFSFFAKFLIFDMYPTIPIFPVLHLFPFFTLQLNLNLKSSGTFKES